jgi:hypothetical protein
MVRLGACARIVKVFGEVGAELSGGLFAPHATIAAPSATAPTAVSIHLVKYPVSFIGVLLWHAWSRRRYGLFEAGPGAESLTDVTHGSEYQVY